jgi:DNA polymerase III epsilon subunit-like protein
MSYTNINSLNDILNKNVLFIDLETSGLVKDCSLFCPPEKRFPKCDSDKYNDCRMIQIGYLQLEDFDFSYDIEIKHIKEKLVKPDNFTIENSFIHGITTEHASEHGKSIKKVLKSISKILEKTDYIIGYSIFFDVSVLMHEFYINGMHDSVKKIQEMINNKKILCVAELCVKCLTKIKINREKVKYNIHKQSKIYNEIFKKDIVNIHNAKYDIYATIEILFWINNKLSK